eukprot:CAMPEP_0194305476 /NCGR_PEP_ID=MMETSP0171-20130528/2905_1 /TAXON_ID=218684 /ORGANISM="Corethron pennatum, Strain L29A3" /LENGTH=766 /DNA_ID=CAMNT_0039057017 /DNA_START=227 /DNA_END=2529 /DNA_ORIENTATION=-
MELPPACLPATASKGPATPSPSTSLSRYSDCALIEIIHLHNCLRGALRALCADVRRLFPLIPVGDGAIPSSVSDVEGKISARFKVIWSVFRAHSSAEDEFIWPALRSKLGRGDSMGSECDYSKAESPPGSPQSLPSNNSSDSLAALAALEEAEYIEDHADEERMFSDFDKLLDDLKNALRRGEDIRPMVSGLGSKAEALSEHLMVHLAKEEEQCMPLVQEHLSPKEITDLVGNIMGKRSSDVVGQIITMAIQNLPVEERKSMVRYMMEAMVGTYFEKWLVMCGFENQLLKADKTAAEQVTPTVPVKPSGSKRPRPGSSAAVPDAPLSAKVARTAPSQLYCTATSSSSMDCLPEQPHTPQQDQHDQQSSASVNPVDDHSFLCGMTDPCLCGASPCPRPRLSGDSPVSGEMLQKLIRAVVQDTTLDMVRKNALIQSLRERVWKSNNLLRERLSQGRRTGLKSSKGTKKNGGTDMSTLPNVLTGSRRKTPPSFYYKRDEAGEIQLVWSSECGFPPADKCVPLFSASELAPTYHDGAAGGVLGCPHYARGCKLRHPSSGRLYTCRLCCEQDRDAPLDRYKVTEVMCMVCGALQPEDPPARTLSVKGASSPLRSTAAASVTSTMTPVRNLSTTAPSAMCAAPGKVSVSTSDTACGATLVSASIRTPMCVSHRHCRDTAPSVTKPCLNPPTAQGTQVWSCDAPLLLQTVCVGARLHVSVVQEVSGGYERPVRHVGPGNSDATDACTVREHEKHGILPGLWGDSFNHVSFYWL